MWNAQVNFPADMIDCTSSQQSNDVGQLLVQVNGLAFTNVNPLMHSDAQLWNSKNVET